jgi:two-component system cell cycle sensor histidine kinase/response regulator CckA
MVLFFIAFICGGLGYIAYTMLGGKETIVDLLISTSLLEFEGVKKVLLSLTDNTERTRDEKIIWDSNQRFQKIFHSHLDAILLLNSETPSKILEVNEAANKLFGYQTGDLVGETTEKLHIDKSHLITFRNKLNSAIEAHGYLDDFEFSMKRKDGTVFLSEHRVVELTDDEGVGTGWVSIVRDLTERKQIEEHLQQAQRMEAIGNLAGGIAHDFNNILFPIIGMSELLLEDLSPSERTYEDVQEILVAGKRGAELIKQILAFSRQNKHERVPVKVPKILKEVLKLSRSTIPANIEISTDIQEDCGDVLGDSTQIHQIAMNLITNAYHSIESNGNSDGKIKVSVKQVIQKADVVENNSLPGGDYVFFSVSDNGIGIKKQVMEKLFEPYFTTKEAGKGTGLGLAVVYGIIKELGGDIKVHSDGVNKGATFGVYLPLMAKNREVAIIDGSPSATQKGTETILWVDDEEPIARLVKQMLERLGYKVVKHTSSIEALNTFKNNPDSFDLVLSDLSMPYMTGEQLAEKIFSIRPNTPVIICTGFSEQINVDAARNTGLKGLLMKPVAKSDMAKMIRKVLDEKTV